MPNKKSAEQRMRNSARKNQRNRQTKSKLKTLENSYAELVEAGKKAEASTVLRGVTAALDKAVKKGVIHSGNADRKKSRLAIRLNRMSEPAAPAAPAPAAVPQ